ncbi:MAG: DUF1186 domain-containing protein [Anaerolineae bacterium]|nr:DUF1186 domain-containing protein [Anaerolineae bacterium]
MTYQQQSDRELLAALESAGPILLPDLIQVCLERQDSLQRPFLDILAACRQDAWELTSDARWFRGNHAGKFLIAYQAETSLPIFAEIYASSDERDQDLVEWFGTDLAHFGETAVSPLVQVLQTDTQGDYHYGRALAATTLKIIALQQPETRKQVVAALCRELPGSPHDLTAEMDIDELWTNIILELADLQDEDSRTQIKGMYAANLVDTDMLSLAEYEASFAEDAPPPPEAADAFDIVAFYDELRHQESHQVKMSGRRNLLRRQGYIPPEPDPQPYVNRFSRWFNERLLGSSDKD